MRMHPTNWKDGNKPARQSYYIVRLEDGNDLVAEWREHDKKQGKRWWHYPTDRPEAELKTPVPLEGVVRFAAVEESDVKRLHRSLMTQAERIEDAYQTYLFQNVTHPLYTTEVPASRLLKPGDRVSVGALKEPVVVELRRGGQDVIFKFHDVTQRSGQIVDNGTVYRATLWTEALPMAELHGTTRFAHERVVYDAYRQTGLESLLHKCLWGLESSPDYQRGYVWQEHDKARYLESVFEGRELGRFIFVKQPYPLLDEILDGKQRLGCLMDFYTSKLAYRGFYYHQLSPNDRMTFENRMVQFAELPAERVDREALLQVFLEVNAAGVPQSEEHLEHVRKLLHVERARKYLATLPQDALLSEMYDQDMELANVLCTALPNFEYPDYSHLPIRKVALKLERQAATSSTDE